jgi:hypothetical protein
MRNLCIAFLVLRAFDFAAARADGTAAAPPTAAPAAATRYTFTWQLGQPDSPTPRGGTTRGAPVTLDTEDSSAWRELQEKGISALERDRRAILAMAGTFRVTFDFLEIDAFKPGVARDRPYQSWGTERVYVDRDTGNSISLVHILDMRVVQKDGSVSEPLVTKHWRQDWRYEPKQLVEYQGLERWQRRRIGQKEGSKQWSQTVYQVDESPRYASIGHWEHSASFSTWISADTWRPLPRREWSVRKDYQVLSGTNRHTITPTGWVQEENNLKTVLNVDRKIDSARPFLAREYGVARYSRLRDADFAAADEYYQRTRAFWGDVVNAWSDVFRRMHRSPCGRPSIRPDCSSGCLNTRTAWPRGTGRTYRKAK